MAKSTNYLATPIERQRQYKIPRQHKINELIHLTEKIKQAWTPLLPEEILNTLMVVSSDSPLLVITTTNHTIANHLTYTHQMLLDLLHSYYSPLCGLSQIKFTVIALKNSSFKPVSTTATGLEKRTSAVNNVTSRKLSATTKQNITQLAQEVTSDKKLSNALLQLIDDEN